MLRLWCILKRSVSICAQYPPKIPQEGEQNDREAEKAVEAEKCTENLPVNRNPYSPLIHSEDSAEPEIYTYLGPKEPFEPSEFWKSQTPKLTTTTAKRGYRVPSSSSDDEVFERKYTGPQLVTTLTEEVSLTEKQVEFPFIRYHVGESSNSRSRSKEARR